MCCDKKAVYREIITLDTGIRLSGRHLESLRTGRSFNGGKDLGYGSISWEINNGEISINYSCNDSACGLIK